MGNIRISDFQRLLRLEGKRGNRGIALDHVSIRDSYVEMGEKSIQNRFKRENLSELVIDYIKEMIINGKYAEGEHIPETEIARELGISRAPVREGIKELQNLGVIEFIPRRGNFVSRYSVEDKKEIFDIRLLIESDMLEILINNNRLKEADFDHLTKIVDEMMMISKGDGDIMQKAALLSKKDIEFHRYIWLKSGSKRRTEILENLHFQLRMAMLYDTKLSGDLQMTAEEHYDIIRCLKKGALECCKTVLRESIYSYKSGIF